MTPAVVRAFGPTSPEPGTGRLRATLTVIVDAHVLDDIHKGDRIELHLPPPSAPSCLQEGSLDGDESRAEATLPSVEAPPVGAAGSPPQSGSTPLLPATDAREPRAAVVKRQIEAKRRRETPAEKEARRSAQHASWTEEARKGFAVDLARLELGIAGDIYVVSAWCEEVSAERIARALPPIKRPSHRDPRERQHLIEVLREGPLRARFLAWATELVAASPKKGKCKSCSAPLVWMMLNDKPHPCDPEILSATKGGRGKRVSLVCEDGMLRGGINLDPEGEIRGRESHYSTCPNAESHRKRAKP